MNILNLIPSGRKLEYELLDNAGKTILSGQLNGIMDDSKVRARIVEIVGVMQQQNASIAGITVAVPFGGKIFTEGVIAGKEELDKLGLLAAQAPMHVPMTRHLIMRLQEILPDTPIIMLFDTAFFADLPVRESSYAISAELASLLDVRRCGYHGLYHRYATRETSAVLRKHDIPGRRILSICLERQPEIAAVNNGHPCYVTSGATPLEGLPGETACGEIDPSIVTALVRAKGWGPEKINNILTRESGILGLTGKKISYDELFAGSVPEYRLATDLIKYRILLACGAGIAAMGGLDAIVFSGRYAALGEQIGDYLQSRLFIPNIIYHCCNRSKFRIMAEYGIKILLQAGKP
ncbi:MAG: hypothetical protein WC071_13100 [Victivallaceae bacterium]